MFASLSDRLSQTLRNLRGQGRITEKNIQDTLGDIRRTLLEADVAFSVVKELTAQIQEQAVGETVLESLTPGQALIKIVNDQLVAVMGGESAGLNLKTTPPAIILVAGLQGSGKTTSVAKLARWLKENEKKSVMVVSTDVYRPAAIDQLKSLAQGVDAHFYPSTPDQRPTAIAKSAIADAKIKGVDVLIIDTAGRLHIDNEMMNEIKELHAATQPIETLFVVDSMQGQDAANTAKAFNDALPLTGVILTKTDGDARGGAALSIRHITGKPIKFIGVGEKTDALEAFHPDRIVSRILGMGDIVSLVETVQRKVDHEKAEKFAKKMHKGQGFNFEDFLEQMQQMKNMGGLTKLMEKLPGFGQLPSTLKTKVNDNFLGKFEAIINSMTQKERRFPDLIKGSRKIRIAKGSGTQIHEVNQLLKQFAQMQKMMKKMSKGGLGKMLKQMKGMIGPEHTQF